MSSVDIMFSYTTHPLSLNNRWGNFTSISES
jgi:hypothetical protein